MSARAKHRPRRTTKHAGAKSTPTVLSVNVSIPKTEMRNGTRIADAAVRAVDAALASRTQAAPALPHASLVISQAPSRPSRHALGCRPDTPDQRDYPFRMTVTRLPASVDLGTHCPPIMDQGQLGSCTAHGTLAAFRYDLISQGKQDEQLSRLMQYWNSRALEGTTTSDAGAEIRDALKAITKSGTCLEAAWPYDVKKFATKPTAKCFTDAKAHEGLTYQRVPQNLAAIKTALASALPVIIGISVYESFESDAVAKSGVVPLPKKSEQLLGGHCMVVIGYNDATQWFTVRNSWGPSWGAKGNCALPYAYLTNADLCSDLWVLSTVTG